MAIKKVTDTNILDGITEESVKKSSQKAENDQHNQGNHIKLPSQSFSFANVISRAYNPCIKASSLTLDSITSDL